MTKKTAASVSDEIRKGITNKIIESLKENRIPWRKTWSDDPNCGRPTNIASKKLYSGINPLILELAALEKQYTSRYWGTYKQFDQLGGKVRRGEKSTHVVFYKVLEVEDTKKDGEKTKKKIFFLRNYSVFNVDQVEGEKLNKYRVKEEPTDRPIDITDHLLDYSTAEKLIASTGAKISYGGNRAFYMRPTPKGSWPKHTAGDYIQIPKKSQFVDAAEFYATNFHELAHWSEVRLDWEDKYEMGELVAEITACNLSAETKVPNRNMENHNRYLQGWLSKMQNDPKWIFHASTQASKVTDYLLGYMTGAQQAENSEQEQEAA